MVSARSALSVNSMSLTLSGWLYVGLVEFMAPGPVRPPVRSRSWLVSVLTLCTS